MPSYYDDNYGEWEIRDQDDVDFYRQTQRSNVRKKCKGCGRWVRIQPDYALCDSCCTKLEHGLDVG